MSIIVYRFGLRPPTENATIVREQIHAAHRYYNDLVQIERGRRAVIRDMLAPYADIQALEDAVREVDSQCETLAHAIRETRQAERRRAETAEQREELKLARARKRELQRLLSERRHALKSDPAIVVGSAEIDERRLEITHAARAGCGVYWGTYQLIEDAAGKAAGDTPMYSGVEPLDPRFARWTGEGTVSVQLMGGRSVSDLYGDGTQVRIDPIDLDRLSHADRRCDRRRAGFTTIHLRVGSDGRAPIWASWPMIQHRALDARSRIKRVTVSVRRRAATLRGGPVEDWSCEITADLPEDVTARLPRASTAETVAVDIGWRVIGEQLRVAYVVASDGYSGDLRIARTTGAFGALEKAADIRSGRDKDLDRLRAALGGWLGAQVELPEWLRNETTSQWRSPSRFAALARRWEERRFSGDGDGWAILDAWRIHDIHLWRWEKDSTQSALRRRRDEYCAFAAQLARRYSTLVLERFDLRRVATRKPLEDDATRDNDESRKNRQRAAVSELRTCLRQAFAARGGSVVEVQAKDTTRTCRSCGLVFEFDAASDVMHACECGAVWDQDANACEVMLVACERARSEAQPGTARADNNSSKIDGVTESRWERARRKRAEKAALIETARKALSSAAESQ